MAVGFACALNLSARAADPEGDGRAIIQSMGDALLATFRAGPDKATREARFCEMYRRNFDNASFAAWAAGRAYTTDSPEQQQECRQLFDTYVSRLTRRCFSNTRAKSS